MSHPVSPAAALVASSVDGRTRTAKARLIEQLQRPPRVVIFGGSRAMKFDPAYITRRTGLTGFNAAVTHARPEDTWALLNLLHARFPRARFRFLWVSTATSSSGGPSVPAVGAVLQKGPCTDGLSGCRAAGLVAAPFDGRIYAATVHRGWGARHRRLLGLLARLRIAYRFSFLDLSRAAAHGFVPGEFYDGIHLTPQGARRVVDLVLERFRARSDCRGDTRTPVRRPPRAVLCCRRAGPAGPSTEGRMGVPVAKRRMLALRSRR